MSDKLKELARNLLTLTPQAKLRVAIELLDRGLHDKAEMVLNSAVAQVRGEQMFGVENYRIIQERELSKL